MGRFARSNDRSKAQAQLEGPRLKVRSWNLEKPRRDLRPRKHSRNERRFLSIISLLLLLIAGAGSGWIIGRIFIGPSESSVIQPTAMAGQLPASVTDKSGAVAGDEAAKVTAPHVEEDADSETAPATKSSAGKNEKTEADLGASAREPQSPAYSAPSHPDRGNKAAQRYLRGRGFQPTTIVTKPAKVLTKPFKKLNPLKIF